MREKICGHVALAIGVVSVGAINFLWYRGVNPYVPHAGQLVDKAAVEKVFES